MYGRQVTIRDLSLLMMDLQSTISFDEAYDQVLGLLKQHPDGDTAEVRAMLEFEMVDALMEAEVRDEEDLIVEGLIRATRHGLIEPDELDEEMADKVANRMQFQEEYAAEDLECIHCQEAIIRSTKHQKGEPNLRCNDCGDRAHYECGDDNGWRQIDNDIFCESCYESVMDAAYYRGAPVTTGYDVDRLQAEESHPKNYMVHADIARIVNSAHRLERLQNMFSDYDEWFKSRLSVSADTLDSLADYLEDQESFIMEEINARDSAEYLRQEMSAETSEPVGNFPKPAPFEGISYRSLLL